MTKLLLVDDDEDILQALKLFLQRKKFEVTALSQASTVVETALSESPDIILMDVNLNGYDGRDICRQLRNDYQVSVPIVLFSAVEEYQTTARGYGASGFINKPFEIKQFVDQLYSYLK